MGVKISVLPPVGAALFTDTFPVVQGGITSQEALSQIATLFGYLGGVLIPLSGGTGVANADASTITLGGPLVFSGAYAFTGTLTGATNLTFPTSGTLAALDANSNLSADNFIAGYATTATAAGNTTLTVGSAYQQFFTGVTTQSVIMPVTSTLVLGQSFWIVNNSTGVVTVKSSGSNTIVAMAANTDATLTCVLLSGTTATSWDYSYNAQNVITLPVSLTNGGTNAALTASNGGIFYSTATAGAILSGTATANQVLLSGTSTAPAWSTAVYPATTTINQLLYSSSANVLAGIATANSSGLLTNGSGVPAWVTFTGTGAPVLGTSPTITTPLIVGVTNASSGAAGNVGQVITSNVADASAVSITTATVTTITSISLTAGDWDVWGLVDFTGNAITNVTTLQAAISLNAAALGDQSTYPALSFAAAGVVPFVSGRISLAVSAIPFTVNAPTTVYLLANSAFSVSTLAGAGTIYARRRR